MSSIVKINERSWGIDLISHINEYLVGKDIIIKRAGGEHSLKAERNTMFPDVLLFGDSQSAKILQGWELKMPDTNIDDAEFIENAYKKAKLLKLNSFLLWNVNYAKLYIIEGDSKSVIKEWQISHLLNTRQEVQTNKKVWKDLLEEILLDISDFINTGRISTTKIIDPLTSDDILTFILENKQILLDEYNKEIVANTNFEDEINLWWKSTCKEYPHNTDKLGVLAEINILSWINKFIFANLIKRYFNQALSIETINSETTVLQAISIIENISKDCDFWNIFKKQLGNEFIPSIIWNNLISLNSFFIDANIQYIDRSNWHNIFEGLIGEKHRKLYGQYSTPSNLAKLLVNLTMENKTLKILDPCCGTGTIAKEAYKLKKQYNVEPNSLSNNVWASDKVAFPLQLTTISLFDPDNSGNVINVFQKDVANLDIGENIQFFDPYTGAEVFKEFPVFDYIVSNLPFVKGQDIPEDNASILSVNAFIEKKAGANFKLDARADLAYYIPFKLWSIINENGKLGIIISNSWLGTESGENFRKVLLKFFFVENVITSGNGRWFNNAKVVTNILILKRKSENSISIDNPQEQVCFTTLKQKIEDLDVDAHISEIRNNNSRDNDVVRKIVYTRSQIASLETLGVQWGALFTNLAWLPSIAEKLINLKTFFDVKRGMKSGLDSFFYSNTPCNQNVFYQPLLKNSKKTKRLFQSEPDSSVFCCNLSLSELQQDYKEVYNKILQASPSTDGKTPPNVSLRSAGENWYKIKSISANIVTSLNPDTRLFFAKVADNLLINQRFILMDRKKNISENTENILHALMNSLLGMFYIECLSFGRGDGVADLSSDRLKECFKVLNPNFLNEIQKQNIIEAFQPLLDRDIKPLFEELECEDRVHFDNVVLSEFGIQNYYNDIKKALLDLYQIRKSVLR